MTTKADDSRKPAGARLLSESERSAFYLWAHQQGFTRLNGSFEQLGEELWRDPKGKIVSAGRIADEHPEWRWSSPKAAAQPRQKPAAALVASLRGAEWARLLPTVALGMILVGALESAIGSRDTSRPPANPATIAPTDSSDRMSLGLRVTSLPNQVQIRWNRQSPVILASASGQLRISEDGVTEVVPFDPAQLRDGSVAYGPKTNDVDIRLEVTGQDGSKTSESVRVVAIP